MLGPGVVPAESGRCTAQEGNRPGAVARRTLAGGGVGGYKQIHVDESTPPECEDGI